MAFGVAAYCRPVVAIVPLMVCVGLLFSDRRALLCMILGDLAPLSAMILTSMSLYGKPFSFVQLQVADRCAMIKHGDPGAWQTPLWEGVAGLLVSPSRGLLFFSPILGLSFWGLFRVHRSEEWPQLRPLAWAVLGIAFLAFKGFDWWGGWSFGYRLLVDALPLMAILMVPVVGEVLQKPVGRWAALALAGWSVFVQIIGAYAYTPGGWNSRIDGYDVPLPTGMRRFESRDEATVAAAQAGIDPGAVREVRMDVDNWEYRHRLWSLADSQIPFLVAHFAQGRKERFDRMNRFLERRE